MKETNIALLLILLIMALFILSYLPTQFPSPTGRAATELPRDASTTFLAHFYSSAVADFIATGCSPTPTTNTGTTIVAGRFGNGILVDTSPTPDVLFYCVNSNVFNNSQGTIEMWVKPNWSGSTAANHTFFAARNTAFNYFQFDKHYYGANDNVLTSWTQGINQYGAVEMNVGNWTSGVWHHIATSWGPAGRKLYIDGVLVNANGSATAAAMGTLPTTFGLGVNPYTAEGNVPTEQASAAIDEVRISNIQRTDAEIAASAGVDETDPSVLITQPTSADSYPTTSSTINMSGTSLDDVGVTRVEWVNNRGGSGNAVGTNSWTASNIPLFIGGTNIITITAYDAAGNFGFDVLAVSYALGDTIAPAAITNLAASNPSQTSISLAWTAPGDDGSTGTATTYDIRYSTAPITAANFNTATQATGEPSPLIAGTNQSFTVIGLNAGTQYYFAIKTADEVPNTSAISNIPTATTLQGPDTIAPAAITNLAASNPSGNSITLTWTAPGDNGSTGTATTYDIRYSTAPITAANFNTATQATGEPSPRPSGQAETFIVSGLNAGTTYYFAVKTADEIPNWSAISNVASGITQSSDTIDPTIIINQPTSSTTYTTTTQTLTLGGTATDNIGGSGLASVTVRVNAGTAQNATLNANNWTLSNISLVQGMNEIIATALDNSENDATATLTVTYNLPNITPIELSSDASTKFLAHYDSTTTADSGVNTAPIQDSGTAITYGLLNKALEIDNASDVLSYSSSNLSINEGTIEFWAKPYWIPSSTSTYNFFDLSNGTANNRLTIGRWFNPGTGGYIYANFSDNGGGGCSGQWWEANSADNSALVREPNVSQSWSPGTWHHIAVAWKNTSPAELKLYVDGKLIHSLSSTAGCSFSTLPAAFKIGNSFASTNPMNALMDEIRVSNIQRNETEIRADAGRETIPPSITINSPTSGTTHTAASSPLTIGGDAFDISGIQRIVWSNSAGGNGNATGTISWSASVSLTPNVQNIVTFTAYDNAGNSAIDSLNVSYNPADTQDPTINITVPLIPPSRSLTSFNPTINFFGSAQDNIGVTQVTWNNSLTSLSGNATLGIPGGTSTGWNASGIQLNHGVNPITFTAFDAANRTGTANVNVTYNDTQPPTATITYPQNNSTVSGIVIIAVSALDNTLIQRIEIYIDNALAATIPSPPYEFSWNTASLPDNSSHTIQARAHDSANLTGNSPLINVTVNNSSQCPSGSSCTTSQSCPGTCASDNLTCNDVPNDNCPVQTQACIDADNDGYGNNCNAGLDCNDSSAGIHPNAYDVCGNATDEDCSGLDRICSESDFSIVRARCELSNNSSNLVDCTTLRIDDRLTQIFTQCENASSTAARSFSSFPTGYIFFDGLANTQRNFTYNGQNPVISQLYPSTTNTFTLKIPKDKSYSNAAFSIKGMRGSMQSDFATSLSIASSWSDVHGALYSYSSSTGFNITATTNNFAAHLNSASRTDSRNVCNQATCDFNVTITANGGGIELSSLLVEYTEAAPAISKVEVEFTGPAISSNETASTLKTVDNVSYLTNETGSISNGITIASAGDYNLSLVCENALGEKISKEISFNVTPGASCNSVANGICDSRCGASDPDCACNTTSNGTCSYECIIGEDPDCSCATQSNGVCISNCPTGQDPDCACNNDSVCQSYENSTCYNDCEPSTPINIGAEPEENAINLSWAVNTEPDIANYIVKYGESSDSLDQSKQTQANKLKISGLKEETTYFFQVIAVDSDGKQSLASNILPFSTLSAGCVADSVCNASCERNADPDCLCNNNNVCEREFENENICPNDCALIPPASSARFAPFLIGLILVIIAAVLAWKYKSLVLKKNE